MNSRTRHEPRRAAAIAAAGLLAAALLLGLGTSARAATPVVDRSFGKSGTLVAAFPKQRGQGLPLSIERTAARRFQVVTGHRVFEYRPDGDPEANFGKAGLLDLQAGLGGRRLEVAGLDREADGGLVVGGTANRLGPREASLETWATVRRYTPDGRLDPIFATGGTFITQFGTPAATELPLEPGMYPTSEYYEAPHVYLSGLELEPGGGLRLEADAVLEAAGCSAGYDQTTTAQIVARLTGGGAPDPAAGPEGVVSRTISPAERCVPIPEHLAHTGPSLRSIGSSAHARAIASASGTDRHGRTVLLVDVFPHDVAPAQVYLVRLTPAGRFDRSFGHDGKVLLPERGGDPYAAFDNLRVAPDGSVLLLGVSYAPRSRSVPNEHIYLGRVDRRGRIDTSFGEDGLVTVPSNPRLHLLGESVVFADLGGERIVVCVPTGGRHRQGFLAVKVNAGD